MKQLVIHVHGVAAPQGSKQGYARAGRVILVESSKAVKPWREAVKYAALDALRVGEEDEYGAAERVGFPFGLAPVELLVTFTFPRPRSHYRTGKYAHELRPGAPAYVAKMPDLDKLIRSTADALTGVVWRDDAQVARIVTAKVYGQRPGAHIVIREVA